MVPQRPLQFQPEYAINAVSVFRRFLSRYCQWYWPILSRYCAPPVYRALTVADAKWNAHH